MNKEKKRITHETEWHVEIYGWSFLLIAFIAGIGMGLLLGAVLFG